MQKIIKKWSQILGIESYHRCKDIEDNAVWVINCNQDKLRKLGCLKDEALSLFYSDAKETIGSLEDIRIVSAANAMSVSR